MHNPQSAGIKDIGFVEEKLPIPLDKRTEKEYNTQELKTKQNILRSHLTASRHDRVNITQGRKSYCVARRIFSVRFFVYSIWRCITISAKELTINDDIRVKEVRMLDENNGQLGIMNLNDAKAYAYERGLDLVLIAPTATPPVARAMDYGKYRYEADKKEKEAKKKQQVVEVKEVQLSCRIDTHDFETKANRAIKFLQDGNKVRVSLRFKGREIAHQELGREMLERFQEAVSEFGTVDKKPVLDGKQLTMFIAPVKNTAK